MRCSLYNFKPFTTTAIFFRNIILFYKSVDQFLYDDCIRSRWVSKSIKQLLSIYLPYNGLFEEWFWVLWFNIIFLEVPYFARVRNNILVNSPVTSAVGKLWISSNILNVISFTGEKNGLFCHFWKTYRSNII